MFYFDNFITKEQVVKVLRYIMAVTLYLMYRYIRYICIYNIYIRSTYVLF